MDELKHSKRELFVSEYGLDTSDIMEDENGKEYIIHLEESDNSEEFEVNEKKIYLPEKLQSNNLPF